MIEIGPNIKTRRCQRRPLRIMVTSRGEVSPFAFVDLACGHTVIGHRSGMMGAHFAGPCYFCPQKDV